MACMCSGGAASARNAARRPAAPPPDVQQLQLQLPSPEFARVRKATYVSSSVDLKGCPPERYPEFAVIGRSNVGKSSLVNLLTGSDRLAKVSKEPGMTKTINHFLINEAWYLVDLPGYGFAKSGRDSRLQWLAFTKDYFLKRDALVSALLLVDGSIAPQRVDLECATWLGEAQVPFAIVFTKTDVKKKGAGGGASTNMAAFKQALLQDWEALPACFETSSKTGAGRTELLQYLASLRVLHEQEGGEEA